MAVVKEKVCRGESQRSIALSGKLKKDGVEGVNSAASAAYLNQRLHMDRQGLRPFRPVSHNVGHIKEG